MAFLRNALKKYPLVTNCAIYGSLYVTAEFCQQTVLKKYLKEPGEPKEPYDTATLQRYAIVGTAEISPMLFYWYKWLDKKLPGTAVKVVVRKCLIDQFLFTPNLLAVFYVSMSILEGKENKFEELQRKFVPTFIVSSCFWLPVQAINFTFMPPHYRVIYIGVSTLLWVNILCWFKRNN